MFAQLAILGPLLVISFADQPEPRLKAAQSQAQRGVEAIVRGDIGEVIDMTHIKAVEVLGGRRKAIERMTVARKNLEKDGKTYLSGKAEVPSTLYKSSRGLYCVVPVSYRIKFDDSRYLMKSPLIGISSDDGKTWKFLDTSPGEEAVRKFVPDMPKELPFPPDEETEVEPGGG